MNVTIAAGRERVLDQDRGAGQEAAPGPERAAAEAVAAARRGDRRRQLREREDHARVHGRHQDVAIIRPPQPPSARPKFQPAKSPEMTYATPEAGEQDPARRAALQLALLHVVGADLLVVDAPASAAVAQPSGPLSKGMTNRPLGRRLGLRGGRMSSAALRSPESRARTPATTAAAPGPAPAPPPPSSSSPRGRSSGAASCESTRRDDRAEAEEQRRAGHVEDDRGEHAEDDVAGGHAGAPRAHRAEERYIEPFSVDRAGEDPFGALEVLADELRRRPASSCRSSRSTSWACWALDCASTGAGWAMWAISSPIWPWTSVIAATSRVGAGRLGEPEVEEHVGAAVDREVADLAHRLDVLAQARQRRRAPTPRSAASTTAPTSTATR